MLDKSDSENEYRENNFSTDSGSEIGEIEDTYHPSNWSIRDWLFLLFPLRDFLVINPEEQTFIDKLYQAMKILVACHNPEIIEPTMQRGAGLRQAWDYFRKTLNYAKPGILDYCLLLLPYILQTVIAWIWAQVDQESPYLTNAGEEKNDDDEISDQSVKFRPWMARIAIIPLYGIKNILVTLRNGASFALIVVFSPIIAIVHVFWGPPEEDGKTPLRQSLFYNPSTWIMGALLLAAISLLIFPWANIAVFTQAAAVLGIMQGLLISMAGLMLVGGFLYTGWRVYHAVRYYRSMGFYEGEVDFTADNTALDYIPAAFLRNNPITKYLGERWNALCANPKTSMLVWGLGTITLGLVIAFTISYFTGGMIPDSFMGQLFDYMSHVFLASIHAIAALPGFEFLSGISDATLLFVGQIVSAVIVCSAVFFITDNISRMIETAGEYLEKIGETEFLVIDPLADEDINSNKNTNQRPNEITNKVYEYSALDLARYHRTKRKEYLAVVNKDAVRSQIGELVWVTEEYYIPENNHLVRIEQLDGSKTCCIDKKDIQAVVLPSRGLDNGNIEHEFYDLNKTIGYGRVFDSNNDQNDDRDSSSESCKGLSYSSSSSDES